MREGKLKKVFLIIFIIVLFIIIGFTNGNNRKVTIVESFLSNIVTLPQNGFTYLKNWITKDTEFFTQVDELKKENEELRTKNEELNAKLINYEVILSENAVLKEHVNLTESYPDYNILNSLKHFCYLLFELFGISEQLILCLILLLEKYD